MCECKKHANPKIKLFELPEELVNTRESVRDFNFESANVWEKEKIRKTFFVDPVLDTKGISLRMIHIISKYTFTPYYHSPKAYKFMWTKLQKPPNFKSRIKIFHSHTLDAHLVRGYYAIILKIFEL